MSRSTNSDDLTDPAIYLHAALRAFVSSATDHITRLLATDSRRGGLSTNYFPYFFNFGEDTTYPDLGTLRDKLRQEVKYWSSRNSFIADLIRLTAMDDSLTEREIFPRLTNFFFCYVKVGKSSSRLVSTVRVLFPVDFECKECPLGQAPSKLVCASSCCYQFSFFPNKPDAMLDAKYDGHYKAAQFAMVDASYAAAAPDLNRSRHSEVKIAPAMVPLLLGQPLLLSDAGSQRPEKFRARLDRNRELVAQPRFPEMNDDLGIRSEALVPLKANPSFMPGFGARPAPAFLPENKYRQGWVPGFPNSLPFCLELYSPMPNWFARSAGSPGNDVAASRDYSFCDEFGRSLPDNIIPIPRFCTLDHADKQFHELSAIWEEIVQILAVGFNLQHYSELMAIQFVEWLRRVLSDGAYLAFVPTLEEEYRAHRAQPKPGELPAEVEKLFEIIRANPRILGDVLTEGHHGGLLLVGRALAPSCHVDLSSIEGLRYLASEVYERTHIRIQVDELPFINCKRHTNTTDIQTMLKSANQAGVLAPLVIEVITNHGRHGHETPILYHVCRDKDEHRLLLHFCSPGVTLDLKSYLNLRQGLPQRAEESTESVGNEASRGGVGLALSRLVAEEHGLEYVIGLGRHGNSRSSEPTFRIQDYRRDLHTRIYFGESV